MTKIHLFVAIFMALAASQSYAGHPQERRVGGDSSHQLRVHAGSKHYYRSPQRKYSTQYHTRTHWRHHPPKRHYAGHRGYHRHHGYVRDHRWDRHSRHHRHDRYCRHSRPHIKSGVRVYLDL